MTRREVMQFVDEALADELDKVAEQDTNAAAVGVVTRVEKSCWND